MLHRLGCIFYEQVIFFHRLERKNKQDCPKGRFVMPRRFSIPRRAFALQRRRTRGKWLSQRRRLGKARK